MVFSRPGYTNGTTDAHIDPHPLTFGQENCVRGKPEAFSPLVP